MRALGVTSQCFEPGVMLLGQYRIQKVVGRGAMGLVVAAWDTGLRQHVAIKLLLGASGSETEPAERFMREARIAVKLKSDHVVRVMNAGTLESGVPYMVMELLDGHDLGNQGPLPIAMAVDCVLQAIDAVAEAHTHHIVHRDLKPSNLFLARRAGASPIIKVLDFGISKATGLEGDPSLTHAEAIMGSPRYMPPEQFRSAKAVDGRSDVWALGAILYTLLRGAPPFDGESIGEVFEAVLQREPPPLRAPRREIPPELEQVVLRCLRKTPAERFANVAMLAQALAPFGSGEWQRCVARANKLLADKTIVIAKGDAFPAPTPSSPNLPFDPTEVPVSHRTRKFVTKPSSLGLVAGTGVVLSLLALLSLVGATGGGARVPAPAAEPVMALREMVPEETAPVAFAAAAPPTSEATPKAPPKPVKARMPLRPTPKPAPKATGTIFDDRH
ncbi:serine/threonine protein kinase [Pendulispora rubella]|uniref:Serine/threonine protein kinase n=1 Tax=Pendulispora rubella TaxID=2741070 RepID=A0ABZ2LF11_9BACT